MNSTHHHKGFTLAEILIAISVFGIIATVVSSLFIDSFRESRRASTQNQLYEDARFIMDTIAQQVHDGMIDYDEYYNQYVVQAHPANGRPLNFGQNFGRYYSAFFNPGTDNRLGFECNDGQRNMKNCVPLKKTIDRATGQNPYDGKRLNGAAPDRENAFCATMRYLRRMAQQDNKGKDFLTGLDVTNCFGENAPNQAQLGFVPELYLISPDARYKTIFARERIGRNSYALSMLKMEGKDTDNDGVYDSFICAPEFQCRGVDGAPGVPLPPPAELINDCPTIGANLPGQLPRPRNEELLPPDAQANDDLCDTKEKGFSKDFVPVSPLRVSISQLQFLIAPLEDPHYAFAEKNQLTQPRVTIVLTVQPNPDYIGARDTLEPFTITQTVSTQLLTPIPAPLLVE